MGENSSSRDNYGVLKFNIEAAASVRQWDKVTSHRDILSTRRLHTSRAILAAQTNLTAGKSISYNLLSSIK